ncbi:MAG TPA: PhnD/SsuA/transferrin family substrate-binding protein, partial [Blastocatellia bacterium]|nr:PhnD/SsuA/transferrin family substrate-binding protein [Blastocatellia bacterium]
LHEGRAQAGAVGDLVWVQESSAGRINTGLVEAIWTTPGFDHCMFDALPELGSDKVEQFRRALYAMSWDDPAHRRILELEGLKQWMPPREDGYDSLRTALSQS